MGDFLRIFFEAISKNETALFFAQLIAVVAALAVLGRFVLRLSSFDRHGATLLTTLGVLGTFAGIFLGLLKFDVGDIDASVPALLEGLKVAFATSILGMASAILLRIFQGIVPQRTEGAGEVTPEIIHSALLEIQNSVVTSAKDQTDVLKEVKQAIAADGESSLLTQIQKLRVSLDDGNRNLIQEFRSFAEKMAENNSKALIDALERVIRDFNTQLNEQFGENFKQLNQAVAALLEWQNNYRKNVEETQNRIMAAVASLQASEDALRKFTEHTNEIPKNLEILKNILDGFKDVNEDLSTHLEAVGALKERALEAFPIIEKNISSLTDEFSTSVRKGIEESENALREQRNAFSSMTEGFGALQISSEDAQSTFKTAIDTTLREIHNQLVNTLDGHSKAIDMSAEAMQQQLLESWQKTQDAINGQFENFDSQMQEELSRALQLLGSQLASLSEKFVSDYGPVADNLRDVIATMRRAS